MTTRPCFDIPSVVTVGVADYHTLATDSPMVDAVRLTGMKWLVLLTELGALAATTSVILVLLIAQPRVLYSMANDGLVPRLFANVHPTYKVRSKLAPIVIPLAKYRFRANIASHGHCLFFFVYYHTHRLHQPAP